MAKTAKTLAELWTLYESLGEQARSFYDKRDAVLLELVSAWKKNKRAPVDKQHCLEIEDSFRGTLKAFAPGFAHRYKPKLRPLIETE